MWSDYIEQKKDVLGGKPVIKNTRIALDLVLEKIGDGETVEDLLDAYPHLTRNEILACINYDAHLVRNETYLDVEPQREALTKRSHEASLNFQNGDVKQGSVKDLINDVENN